MIAIGVFFLYAKLGMINSISGLVMAHSMLAMPLVVIVVAAGLKSYDMNQEMVARSLGASRAYAFLTITLPQIRFSVITGALLAFLTSLDEVIVALFVSGGENATITRRMFNALRDQIDPTIASVSSLIKTLVALSTVSLAMAKGSVSSSSIGKALAAVILMPGITSAGLYKPVSSVQGICRQRYASRFSILTASLVP